MEDGFGDLDEEDVYSCLFVKNVIVGSTLMNIGYDNNRGLDVVMATKLSLLKRN